MTEKREGARDNRAASSTKDAVTRSRISGSDRNRWVASWGAGEALILIAYLRTKKASQRPPLPPWNSCLTRRVECATRPVLAWIRELTYNVAKNVFHVSSVKVTILR